MLIFNVIPWYQGLLFRDFLLIFFRFFFFSIGPTDSILGNAFDTNRKKTGDVLMGKSSVDRKPTKENKSKRKTAIQI